MMTNKTYAFEDFPPGHVAEFGGMTVQRDDIVRFAAEFDPQPFHVSEDAARHSLFKKLTASGWHTCAMVMRMNCDAYLLDSTSLGSPGIEHLKWTRPVHAGDTLRVRMTVLEARPMKSKPHVGLVRSRWEALNQHGEVVLEMEGWGMFGRRDVAPPG
jgi:acyl dehydratase